MYKYYPSPWKVLDDTIKELKRLKLFNSHKMYTKHKKKKKEKKRKIEFKTINNDNKDLISLNAGVNYLQKKKSNSIIYKIEDINDLPFSQAIYKDKRNFVSIFISIIIQKIDLVNLIFGGQKIKILLIYQYIL